MKLEGNGPLDPQIDAHWLTGPRKRILVASAVVFFIAYIVLFLSMERQTDIYDEGLVLTAAMRVAAGQIPHRDFYINYGPAQFYLIAGLFKLFGQSIFVERLYDLFLKALTVSAVYAIGAVYSRRSIAMVIAAIVTLWQIGLAGLTASPVIPVSVLNLAGVALVLPAFMRKLSFRRMFAAGAVAGLAMLFRYDTGVALFALQVAVLTIAVYRKSEPQKWYALFTAIWRLLLGFAAVTVPSALIYLSLASPQPLLFDIVQYPAKHYARGRHLPFPPVTFKNFESIEVYVLLGVMAVALLAIARGRVLRSEALRWQGFVIAFSLLALLMYFKGIVRVDLGQMFLSTVPSLLLLAVLFEHRAALSRPLQIGVLALAALSVAAGTWSFLHEVRRLQVYHLSVPEGVARSIAGTLPPVEAAWCRIPGPLTRGLCFYAEDDRLQMIEFIDSHTTPADKLYVGLPQHDRIFANDNLTYFAAHRLPATMWSHFDPGLQNSAEIQRQMIHELVAAAPPYVVLDPTFTHVREPNESGNSTGVLLLDEYLHTTYRPVATFGTLSVLERKK